MECSLALPAIFLCLLLYLLSPCLPPSLWSQVFGVEWVGSFGNMCNLAPFSPHTTFLPCLLHSAYPLPFLFATSLLCPSSSPSLSPSPYTLPPPYHALLPAHCPFLFLMSNITHTCTLHTLTISSFFYFWVQPSLPSCMCLLLSFLPSSSSHLPTYLPSFTTFLLSSSSTCLLPNHFPACFL